MIDLSGFNLTQLADLRKQIDVEIVRRRESEKQNLRAEIQRLAAAAGLSLSEVLSEISSDKKVRKATTAGVAQYANPADNSQTWTGRGRKPQWVIEWLATGKSLDDLRI